MLKINEIQTTVKFYLKKVKLKYIGATIIIIFLLDYFGVFVHLFETDYDTKFVYPLDINIEDMLMKMRNGLQPDIKPINEYNYRFKIKNENKCLKKGIGKTTEDIALLYVIKSALENYAQRNAIRNSWGWENRFSDVVIKRVFVLGINPDNLLIQDKIDEEFGKYKDLIQADFVDSYYNNTIKTMIAFKWVVNYCQKTQFVLFSDDDMYISTKNLLAFIRNPYNINLYERKLLFSSTSSKNDKWETENLSMLKSRTLSSINQIYDNRLLAGYVFVSAPMRHKPSKWYITLEEYPFSKYPPYVTAGAYLASQAAVIDIYYTSLYTKHFRFDDIFLGIVAKKAGIVPLHNENFYFWKKDYDKDSYASVIASHGFQDPKELLKIWEEQRSLGHA